MIRILTFFLLGAVLAACADLSAVREFSAVSVQSARYTQLADDYAGAPERLARYVTNDRQRESLALDAKLRQQQKQKALALHTAIEQYMQALGKLAGGKEGHLDAEIKALSKSAKQLGGSSDVEKAVQSTAQALQDAVLVPWQRRRIQQAVDEANAGLQLIVRNLRDDIDLNFRSALEKDITATEFHYRELIAQSRDPAGIRALQEWQDLRVAELKRKQGALDAYVKIMNQVAAGHQALYEAGGQFTRAGIRAELKQYSATLKDLHKSLGKLLQGVTG